MRKSQTLPAMLLAVILTASFSISWAQDNAAQFKGFNVIRLKNGPNRIDINGDGVADNIFVARRENFNAHGFDLFAFYVWHKETVIDDRWHVVPFFDEKGAEPHEKEHLITFEGADCTLSDIRLLHAASSKSAPVIVIKGVREFGNSFADDAPVAFQVYELRRNKEMIVGYPPYYFELTRTIAGKKKYCDINDAFQQELGLAWGRSDRLQNPL
jgi:hypothetical protein